MSFDEDNIRRWLYGVLVVVVVVGVLIENAFRESPKPLQEESSLRMQNTRSHWDASDSFDGFCSLLVNALPVEERHVTYDHCFRGAVAVCGSEPILGCLIDRGDLVAKQTWALSTLTLEALQNARYDCNAHVGDFTLKQGIFDIPHLELGRINLSDSYTAYGDFDADGDDDAAVVLAYVSGGTGVWPFLYLMLNDDGHPKCTASAELGDKSDIHSLKIGPGVVTIDISVHRPDDPYRQPSARTILEYRLKDGKFVQTGMPTGTSMAYYFDNRVVGEPLVGLTAEQKEATAVRDKELRKRFQISSRDIVQDFTHDARVVERCVDECRRTYERLDGRFNLGGCNMSCTQQIIDAGLQRGQSDLARWNKHRGECTRQCGLCVVISGDEHASCESCEMDCLSLTYEKSWPDVRSDSSR